MKIENEEKSKVMAKGKEIELIFFHLSMLKIATTIFVNFNNFKR